MTTTRSILVFCYEKVLRISHRAWGWLTRGCLLGILAACFYNFLFINDEIGALSEQSMSEEKSIYGIKLFGTRVITWALIGAIVGGLLEIYFYIKRTREDYRSNGEEDRVSS